MNKINDYDVLVELLFCEYGLYKPKERRTRCREICTYRQVIAYCLVKNCGVTYSKVGRLLGGYHHATILHSVAKIEDEIGLYQETKTMYEYVSKYIEKYFEERQDDYCYLGVS